MKYCEDYAALLDPYIDGELSPEDTARVREHLTVCGGCRAYVQAALLLRENFPEIEETEVPDGFAASVMGAIRSDAAPRKKRRTPWVKVLAPLAACCAIVILVKSLPMDAATADTASAGIVTEETVPETAQTRDDTAAARNSEPEAAETEEPPVGEASTPAAETAGETPEIGTKTGTAADAVQPHAYTAQTNGQEDAGAIAEEDTGAIAQEGTEAVTEGAGAAAEDGAGTENAGAAAEDAAQPETPSENSVAAATTSAADSWVENGNVVFSFTVFLSKDTVADALDGYEGKPYSNANFPDKGVIGTGYAMTVEEAEHILYDVLDTPLGPAENPERTTELCCIVVTEEEISSSSIGK